LLPQAPEKLLHYPEKLFNMFEKQYPEKTLNNFENQVKSKKEVTPGDIAKVAEIV
jgi:hypothetical protein